MIIYKFSKADKFSGKKTLCYSFGSVNIENTGTPVLGQESFIKAWRDESARESAYYSSRGPEFSFQHTHGSSQPLACLVTGVWCCLLTLVYHTHMTYTKSHSVIHMHIKKLY